jgi:hypothetical protein
MSGEQELERGGRGERGVVVKQGPELETRSRTICRTIVGLFVLALLGQASGCAHSRLHGLSDADARALIVADIPLGTSRAQARTAIDSLGPDKKEEVWTTWPPPMAASTITAYFDTERPFVNGRVAVFEFNEKGLLEKLDLVPDHKYVYP